MPIPNFQEIMLPLLQLTADDKEHNLKDTIEQLANYFNLTSEERQLKLPSGLNSFFDNRVGWAKTYLLKSGLLESPRRSIFKITTRGHEILDQNPNNINIRMLRQFPEFMEFINPGAAIEDEHLTTVQFANSQSTPEEILEASYQEIRQTLVQELLQKIKFISPSFFERLVIELLIKMGYGGSFRDAGRATRLTNDGGIDGIIKEDKLGLDIIYIQAKRWDNQVVGRPEIQSFVGALDGQRANKGIFITTSYF